MVSAYQRCSALLRLNILVNLHLVHDLLMLIMSVESVARPTLLKNLMSLAGAVLLKELRLTINLHVLHRLPVTTGFVVCARCLDILWQTRILRSIVLFREVGSGAEIKA